MNIGQRRCLVRLQNPGTPVPDGDGGFTRPYVDLAPPTRYARVVTPTAKDLEHLAGGTVLSTLSRVVSMPYHPDVTTETRLSWTDGAGRAHAANVTGVQADERSLSLELVCVEVVA
jgi:hypothetical protein